MRYRIVKLMKSSSDCCWAIQKEFKSWFTGKTRWKYYDPDWGRICWTKNPNWAEKFFTEENAEAEVTQLIKHDCRSMDRITVVKEICADDTGNININYEERHQIPDRT